MHDRKDKDVILVGSVQDTEWEAVGEAAPYLVLKNLPGSGTVENVQDG